MPPVLERRHWIGLLQLAIGIGLIVVLIARMDNRQDVLTALSTVMQRWHYAAAAILCFLGCLLTATWRWHMILSAHAMTISFVQAFRLSLVGQFFNAFMFGAVGGDAVKALYVAGVFPQRRTESVTTIFIDRIIGMLALVALATAILLVRMPFFLRYPETRIVCYGLMATLMAVTLLLVAAFRRNVFEHFAFFRRLEETTSLGATLSRIYRAFHGCLTHPGLLTRTLLLSLINHLLFIVAAYLLGTGLQIQTIQPAEARQNSAIRPFAEFGTYLTVFPVINGIATLPATPGGLGTRETATKFLLGVPEFGVQPSRAVTLSLLLYAITLFWSLVGGVVYTISESST